MYFILLLLIYDIKTELTQLSSSRQQQWMLSCCLETLFSIKLLCSFQGKGSMKTYWLLEREPTEDSTSRCPFGSILLEELKKVKGSDEMFNENNNLHATEQGDNTPEYSNLRTFYSPVSFDDVKRSKSSQSTPSESPAKHINLSRTHSGHSTNNYTELVSQKSALSSSKEREMVIIKNNIDKNNKDNNKLLYDPSGTSKTCVVL